MKMDKKEKRNIPAADRQEAAPFDYPVDLEAGQKRCPHFGRCGGCQLLSVPYPDQLRLKQAYL